ncbi:MAG: hypothetical protein ACLFVE_02195 [Chitinispirillaceae bacterium]
MMVKICLRIMALFVVGIAVNEVPAVKKPDYHQALQKGVGLLEENPDSALNCFVEAYSQGLSRDSLFYYWSQSRLHKGVLDSALASNYMIKSSHSGHFRKDVLVQRYTIYKRLGWEKDAERVLDTLKACRSPFLPDIDVKVKSGVDRGKTVADTSSPWGGGAQSPVSQTGNDFFSSAEFSSTWRRQKMSAGLKMEASMRTGLRASDAQMGDSVSVNGKLFLNYNGKPFSLSGALSVIRQIDDTLLVGTDIQGGKIANGMWLPMIWGGAGLYYNAGGDFDNFRLWTFASVRRSLDKRVSAELSGFVNVNIENTCSFTLTENPARVFYAEDARLQYPVFYTDSDFNTVIDTSLIIRLKNEILSSGSDTLIPVAFKQPFSSIMLNPKASIKLNSRFPVSFGLSYIFDYYWEPYEWDQIRSSSQYIVFSRSEGRYYYIPDDFKIEGNNEGLALSPQLLPGDVVVHHSEIRIDNTLCADISLILYDGKAGKVNIESAYSRTWSTLSRRAPIKIPEWSVSAMLKWRLRVNNGKI